MQPLCKRREPTSLAPASTIEFPMPSSEQSSRLWPPDFSLISPSKINFTKISIFSLQWLFPWFSAPSSLTINGLYFHWMLNCIIFCFDCFLLQRYNDDQLLLIIHFTSRLHILQTTEKLRKNKTIIFEMNSLVFNRFILHLQLEIIAKRYEAG